MPPPLRTRRISAANATDFIRDQVLLRIEPAAAVRMSQPELTARVDQLIAEIGTEQKILMNQAEQRTLAAAIVDDMIGLGPLEPLLRDDSVADILVNGPHMIYVERRGKLELTALQFRHDAHVLHVAQRIASAIGRRVDESSPMLDARLADGSRVNVIIPPLSLKGPCISIRKFSRAMMDFSKFVQVDSMSIELSHVLEIAARCRLNIVISGGTGSGKTTLLNALSQMIDHGERIITIEDAAELQLQQPHVIQLETRPANIEGTGQIAQRDLVRNALRMRPDRIIIGEVRGAEAFDMMQAMNTGHNGSMSTIHSNSARDAIARIENMILMANVNLPLRAIRGQIASAVDLIVHTERMRDGVRRVTEVVEVVGMEEEIITLGSLFAYRYRGENPDGSLNGVFEIIGEAPALLAAHRVFRPRRKIHTGAGRRSAGDLIMLILLGAVGFLLASWLVLFGAVVLNRRVTKRMDERLGLVSSIAAVQAERALPASRLAEYLGAGAAQLRSMFAFGLPYVWAMHSGGFYLAAVGLFVGGAAWLLFSSTLHLPLFVSVPLAVAAFIGVPRTLLKREQSKAERRFQDVFPDAIDMVIRMLRAGLPISSAVQTVGAEGPQPVNEAFREIADQMRIGIPLNDAMRAIGERIGLTDFRFFVVAVALQHATGGNLALTLDTLSDIMRKRRAMRLKGRATTGEVRISAYILGGLPFFVTLILLLINPAYMAPLITDPRGNVIIGLAILGLFAGFLSMRRMMRRLDV